MCGAAWKLVDTAKRTRYAPKMITPQAVVAQFVADSGGVRKTAAVLGVSPALVCRVCNGTRRLTPDFAMRVERASNGRISKAALIWGAAA